MLFIQAAIETKEVGDFREMNAIQPQAKALYEQGLIHIEDGRENALERYRNFAAQLPKTDYERRLKKVLTEIFADNVPESFDMEERMLSAISGRLVE